MNELSITKLMKEITLDELIQQVQEKEKITKEPEEVLKMIQGTATEVVSFAKQGKVEIFTDYDADGISSAYIMEKTIKAINPSCEVTVHCNDRRGSYGLSEDVYPDDDDAKCIVLDMGSNQVEVAKDNLGSDVLIIDHHLVEDNEKREKYKSDFENFAVKTLCNPHILNEDDSKNAQYCATGLSYRIHQECSEICKEQFLIDEKTKNAVAVMACVGTVTDMVNVLDVNSHNRQIIKDGLKIIDNATEKNLDFVIGNILARNGIGEIATAHNVAFNVGSFINSASRMSETAKTNGAQEMYDTLISEPKFTTFKKIEKLENQNSERKILISQIVKEDNYKNFVNENRFGEKKNDNIAVYQLPDNTPSAIAGLIAGKLAESCNKAIICLTYKEKEGYYSGSGRNVETNETSLIEFMKKVIDNSNLKINYGGHEDAIGISSLNDIKTFKELVEKNSIEMKEKNINERNILKLSPKEISSEETFNKMLQLEPIGIGLKIPPVHIEGKELRRNMGFVKNREDWKRVQIKLDTTTLTVSDWSYSPENYPQNIKGEISFIAELGLNDFKGLHVEASAKFDRSFIHNRIEVVKIETVEKDNQQKKKDISSFELDK